MRLRYINIDRFNLTEFQKSELVYIYYIIAKNTNDILFVLENNRIGFCNNIKNIYKVSKIISSNEHIIKRFRKLYNAINDDFDILINNEILDLQYGNKELRQYIRLIRKYLFVF